MQMRAAQQQAEYNAAVQRNNQIIAQQNADYVLKQGRIAADKHREKVAQAIGTGKVALAARGLAVDAVNEVGDDVLRDLMLAGWTDILTIEHNTKLEQRRALIQKDQFKAEEDLLTMRANSINPALGGLLAGYEALPADFFKSKP